MQWKGPYTMESHLQVLTSNKDDATTAVARVIYQDIDPEMEVPDSGGYHQKEGV